MNIESDEYLDSLVGAAIKEARESKHLTQKQLGEKVGVQRARICSIEKGVNLRLSTLRRIFKALDMNAYLEIKGFGSVALYERLDKIENETQYENIMQRIEELLLIVTNETSIVDPNFIELDRLSSMVEAYEKIHYNINDLK